MIKVVDKSFFELVYFMYNILLLYRSYLGQYFVFLFPLNDFFV